jgi:hypothetical protein
VPPEARRLVAGLRERGDGADLDVPEAEHGQPGDAHGVLVEAGGQAEARGERATEHLHPAGGRRGHDRADD